MSQGPSFRPYAFAGRTSAHARPDQQIRAGLAPALRESTPSWPRCRAGDAVPRRPAPPSGRENERAARVSEADVGPLELRHRQQVAPGRLRRRRRPERAGVNRALTQLFLAHNGADDSEELRAKIGAALERNAKAAGLTGEELGSRAFDEEGQLTRQEHGTIKDIGTAVQIHRCVRGARARTPRCGWADWRWTFTVSSPFPKDRASSRPCNILRGRARDAVIHRGR